MAAVIRHEPASSRDRYNIYVIVHKGLRGFMTDVLMRWGRVDVADDCERGQAVEQARELLALCKGHLQHENGVLHPAIERVRPGFTARIALEHAGHEAEITLLEAQLAELVDAPPAQHAPLAQRFYQRLSGFVAENLEHMLVEETENHRALIEAYSDEQVLGLEQAIVASMPPEKTFTWLRWMIPHINATERAFMLGGMKAGAPAEVFAGVMALAREVLSQRDYYKLERALA